MFAAVERMSAPRLVEYWEKDPCWQQHEETERGTGAGYGVGGGRGGMRGRSDPDDLGVTVEAKFVVGEYEIAILSAKDSTGLDTRLRQQKYNIPAGAAIRAPAPACAWTSSRPSAST